MSEIRTDTISAANGTDPVTLTKQSAAKAWVNFNGTGTIAINESLNVSSLTDSSTGVYYINFSNNFSTNKYSVAVGASNSNSNNNTGNSLGYSSLYSVSQYSFAHFELGTETDTSRVNNTIHGDLA